MLGDFMQEIESNIQFEIMAREDCYAEINNFFDFKLSQRLIVSIPIYY